MTWLIRVNNTVYTGKKPATIDVRPPMPDTDTVDLDKRPVGLQGKPVAVLEWERMSAEDYRWWLDFTESSVTLSDLALPDEETAGTVSQGGTDYTGHRAWSSGELWRPIKTPGATSIEVNGEAYIEGIVQVRIVELVE